MRYMVLDGAGVALLPNFAVADDLAQETMLKVFRSRAALRDGPRLEAWLYRSARTTLIDFYRRQRPGADPPCLRPGRDHARRAAGVGLCVRNCANPAR
jgi:DNA-directed RNA polymerase specialized sigma24 family protein